MTCPPPPPSPAPRRKASAPLDNDLRARLSAALADGPAEPIAAAATMSVATVRKAARGEPVRPIVRAALARVMPPTAATATYALRDIIRDAPLPAPPAPPQSPLPSPDGGTGPRGGAAPAGGCGVAEAYVEAAGVCERMAQAHDRLAAAADSEGAERRQREAAGVLRCAADRIRALAGGP